MLRVSAGRISITPPDVVGKPMAGYSRPHPARGILDEIKAHGVLLEETAIGNVKKHLLLLSLDVLKPQMVFVDYMKEKIQEAHGIAPDQVLVHATHTHSAPDLTGEFHWPGGPVSTIRGILFGMNRNDKMLVWMVRRIVRLVGTLLESLRPAKMAWKKTVLEDEIIINRRHPARRTKPALGVICFKSLEAPVPGIMLVNVGAHGTALQMMNDKISADYPGRLVAAVEEMTGGKTKAVFFNAACGDLNPITTCGTDYDFLEKHPGPVYGQKGNYEHAIRIGRKIAERALELARSIPDEAYHETIEIKSHVRTFSFPMKDFKRYHSDSPLDATLAKLQNRLIFLLKKYLLFPIVFAMIGHGKEPNFPGLALKHRGREISIYTKLQYVIFKAIGEHGEVIDDCSIMTVPGELFQGINDVLVSASITGKDSTFMFQNSNDWTSYLFDLAEYLEAGGLTQKGYEVLPSATPLAGYYVKREFLRFIDEIRHGLTGGYS